MFSPSRVTLVHLKSLRLPWSNSNITRHLNANVLPFDLHILTFELEVCWNENQMSWLNRSARLDFPTPAAFDQDLQTILIAISLLVSSLLTLVRRSNGRVEMPAFDLQPFKCQVPDLCSPRFTALWASAYSRTIGLDKVVPSRFEFEYDHWQCTVSSL